MAKIIGKMTIEKCDRGFTYKKFSYPSMQRLEEHATAILVGDRNIRAVKVEDATTGKVLFSKMVRRPRRETSIIVTHDEVYWCVAFVGHAEALKLFEEKYGYAPEKVLVDQNNPSRLWVGPAKHIIV